MHVMHPVRTFGRPTRNFVKSVVSSKSAAGSKGFQMVDHANHSTESVAHAGKSTATDRYWVQACIADWSWQLGSSFRMTVGSGVNDLSPTWLFRHRADEDEDSCPSGPVKVHDILWLTGFSRVFVDLRQGTKPPRFSNCRLTFSPERPLYYDQANHMSTLWICSGHHFHRESTNYLLEIEVLCMRKVGQEDRALRDVSPHRKADFAAARFRHNHD